jgi:hypothetical protein
MDLMDSQGGRGGHCAEDIRKFIEDCLDGCVSGVIRRFQLDGADVVLVKLR